MPFTIIRDDITRVHADAIVNSADPQPIVGGGAEAAIYQAAGMEDLLREREKIGRLQVCQTAYTSAFALHAKYIIHTCGPVWSSLPSIDLHRLSVCYRRCMELAERLGCESIAFPLISAGSFGFPKEKALTCALNTIRKYLENSDLQVILVVYNKDAYRISQKLHEKVEQYLTDEEIREDRYSQNVPRDPAFLHRREYAYRGQTSDKPFSSPQLSDVQESLEEADFDYDASEAPVMGAAEESLAEILPEEEPEGISDEEPKSVLDEEPEEAEERSEATSDAGTEDRSGESLQTVSAGMRLEPEGCSSDRKKPDAGYSERVSEAFAPGWRKEERPSGMQYAPSAPSKTAGRPQGRKNRKLEDVMSHLGETFQQRLLRLIDERHLEDRTVYKRANIDRKLFSKIRCNDQYKPQKKTAVALAIALELSLDETVDLLSRAELALSPSSRFDLIIMYCLDNRIYNIYEINALLFEYEQPLLGA